MKLVPAFALALALAGVPVDQGKPGIQGPWPVAVVSGGLPADGGYLGTILAVQGPGIDGGTAWNVSGSIGGSSNSWEYVAEFDLAAWLATYGSLTSTRRITIGYPPDGGAFTWNLDTTSSTAPTDLMVRPMDVEGRAVQLRVYVSNATTAPIVTLYQYGYPYPTETTIGARAVFTTTVFNMSSGGAIYSMGWTSPSSSLFHPVRPPAFAVRISTGATLSSLGAAKIQLWRLP